MGFIARLRGARTGLVLGTAIALAGFGIGVTVATIPSGGVISGCYKTTTGALRVIDYPGKKCVSGEKMVRWDQAGAAATVTLTEIVGTACTVGPGKTAKLHAEVNPATGVVTLRCDTILRVAGTATFTKIILSPTTPGPTSECGTVTSCALNLPLGTPATVQMFSADDFTYTCPGASPQGSKVDVSGTVWQAQCDVVMTNDLTVVTSPRT